MTAKRVSFNEHLTLFAVRPVHNKSHILVVLSLVGYTDGKPLPLLSSLSQPTVARATETAAKMCVKSLVSHIFRHAPVTKCANTAFSHIHHPKCPGDHPLLHKTALQLPARLIRVPRMGLEPTQTLLPKGFSCCYGFRHRKNSVRSLDYSFTMESSSLGVPCLVSAPSFLRLGSRLPSALPAKASLNLRYSTSLFSERALNFVFPR